MKMDRLARHRMVVSPRFSAAPPGLVLLLSAYPGFRFARSREKININVRVSGRERHLV
jgi:hypothetical protein